MATNFPSRSFYDSLLVAPYYPTGASNTKALSSNYVYGTSGIACATMFCAYQTGDITDIWIYIDSYNGTWGNTDTDILIEIREDVPANYRCGSTLVGSATVDLSLSPTGWVKVTGLTIPVVAGHGYQLSIGDPDGDGTDHVVVLENGPTSAGNMVRGFGNAFATTDGWQTGASGGGGPVPSAISIDGVIQVFGVKNTWVSPASDTKQKGVRFKVKGNLTLVGFWWYDVAQWFGSTGAFRLYEDSETPSGTFLMEATGQGGTILGSTVPNNITFDPSDWVELTEDAWYRFVWAPATSSTVPRQTTYPGSPDATLLASLKGWEGNLHWTLEDTASLWDDDTDATAVLAPIFLPTDAAAGGGGGGMRLVGTGGLITPA